MAHFNNSKLCMMISLIIYLKQCARVRIYTTTKTKKAFHFFIETNCDLLNYFNIIEQMDFDPIHRYFDHRSSSKIKVIAGFSPKRIELCRPNNYQYIIILNPPSAREAGRWGVGQSRAVGQAAWLLLLEIETESLRGGACFEKGGMHGSIIFKIYLINT